MMEAGLLSTKIPISVTLGSTLNIVYFIVGLIVTPTLMMLLRPQQKEATVLEEMLDDQSTTTSLTVEEEAQRMKFSFPTLSDTLNHGWIPQLLISLAGVIYIVSHFARNGFDINLEIMIFIFLIAGMLAHRTPMNYVLAMKRACSNVSGIIFQYPFYAGIMGRMIFTGLGSMISAWMASFATTTSVFAGASSNTLIRFCKAMPLKKPRSRRAARATA